MQNNIKLRPLLMNDEGFIQTLFNTEGVYNSGFLTLFYPMSDLQIKSFLNNTLSSQSDKNFIINLDGNEIGLAQISEIDYINSKCELGVLLDPEYQNKGLGSEVFLLLISICFNQLNLNKIECEFISTNSRSAAIFEKLGFKEEGSLAESVFRDGVYHEKKIYGLTRDSYFKKAGRL
jgi:diamine N-acetyltransferase